MIQNNFFKQNFHECSKASRHGLRFFSLLCHIPMKLTCSLSNQNSVKNISKPQQVQAFFGAEVIRV